jgi:hypothetical protein
MRKLTLLAAAVLAATSMTPAYATVTLFNGNNSLTDQIHLDATFDNSDVATVHGITTSGLQILFTGNVNIDGTSGSGYAQINDSASAGVFNTLTITPANFTGFTDYEFSIMYNGSNQAPIYLTIGYTLLGGGSGSFVFDPLAANNTPLNNLLFTNNANRDFLISATGGDIITSLVLSGRLGPGANDPLAPILQEKQNDIAAVTGVPEPATWAMMLLGFGAAGAAMRRDRRRKALLTQVA